MPDTFDLGLDPVSVSRANEAAILAAASAHAPEGAELQVMHDEAFLGDDGRQYRFMVSGPGVLLGVSAHAGPDGALQTPSCTVL